MWRNACASISHICPPLTRCSQLLANFVEIFRQISWKYPGKSPARKYSENMPACAAIGYILSKRSKNCGEEISTGEETGSGGSWDLFVKSANTYTEQLLVRPSRNLMFSIEGDWNTVTPLNWLVRPCVTWCDIVTGWHGVTRWHGVTQRHDSSGCPSDWCHSCLPAREGSRVILWDLRTLYFLYNAKTN